MTKRDRIAVEVPPCDASRARVEPRVFGQLDAIRSAERAGRLTAERPAPRRWGYAAAACAAAAAAVLGIALWPGSPAPSAPSQVVTPAGGSSRFTVDDATIDVGSATDVEVRSADEGGVTLVLGRGTLVCDVAPRKGRPLRVRAGDVVVEVVGTRFSVIRTAGVRVEVSHGTVRVKAHGEELLVGAGERWTDGAAPPASSPAAPLSPPPSPIERPTPSPTSGASGTSEAVATQASNAVTPPASNAVTPPASNAVAPAPASNAAASAPASNAAASPSASNGVALPPAREAVTPPPAGNAAVPSPAGDAVAPPPASDPVASPPVSAKRTAWPASREAFRAAQRLQSNDPRAAARAYRALANGDNAWAALALYSLAELDASSGRSSEALAAVDEYLRRFPRGAGTEDVLWIRIETLRALGRQDDARDAAARYLQRFPRGTYVKPAARVAAPP